MMSLSYAVCQSGEPIYTDWQQPTLNYVEWQQPQPPYVGPESYRQPCVQWQPPYQTHPQQMQSGHQTIDYYQLPFYPQPPDPPDWRCHSTDLVTPDLEPNLSMTDLVSQLERLTAEVEQLVSQMDANERRLSDPQAAMRPPPAPAFSVHQALHSASHYTAAPYTVQPHINPDIAGSLQQPPTQLSPPCKHDIRYGSIESLADDTDAHESEQSRQIHYDDILSDQLLNGDPIGNDEVLLEVGEFMQVANEKQFDLDLSYVIAKDIIHSSVGSFTLSTVEASMELIVKEVDSGFGRNGSDKKWIFADNTDEHRTVGINLCSSTLDTDARLIPPRIDSTCLGIPGCVDMLHFWAPDNHKAEECVWNKTVCKDHEPNLVESLDGSVEVSGVTDVEVSECKDDGQVCTLNKTPNMFSSFDYYWISLTVPLMEEMHVAIMSYITALHSAPLHEVFNIKNPKSTRLVDHILLYTLSLKAKGEIFANLRFARMRGEVYSGISEKVEQTELLRAHHFRFVILRGLVMHSPPIGEFWREDHSNENELFLVQDFFGYTEDVVTEGAANDTFIKMGSEKDNNEFIEKDIDSPQNDISYGNKENSVDQVASGDADSGKSYERIGGYGGPRGFFRGGFSNGDGEGDRPRRPLDRRRRIGCDYESKREGAGCGTWGTRTDEYVHVAGYLDFYPLLYLGAANLNVFQEAECVKHEAKTIFLLKCFQATTPPVLVLCEKKEEMDDIHEDFLLKSCLYEKLGHMTYGFGDVILFGSCQRLKKDEYQEFHNVFLDSRISKSGCLLAHWFPP